MTDDWNLRRKARGRIRRAKLRRRRQRVTAASLVLLLFFSVFAIGSVRYGVARNAEPRIVNQNRISYAMPAIVPQLALAEVKKPDNQLPQLLFAERFPDYRNPPGADNRNDQRGDRDRPPADAATQNMVILDDLRAAPPKSMFIQAIFENADDNVQPKRRTPSRWVFDDPVESMFDLVGYSPRNDPANPVVPEPGTGILLALGLTVLAGRRRRKATRSDTTSNPKSRAIESNDGRERQGPNRERSWGFA